MSELFPVRVFHNPNCSTSKKAVDAAKASGHPVEVVEYMKTGWTRDVLTGLLARMGVGPRDILRTRNTRAEELGLTAPGVADETIIDAMVADPVLVERPIVESEKGVVLARPLERMDEVL